MKKMDLRCLFKQCAVYFLLVRLRAIKISNEKPFIFKLEPSCLYEEALFIKKRHLKKIAKKYRKNS